MTEDRRSKTPGSKLCNVSTGPSSRVPGFGTKFIENYIGIGPQSWQPALINYLLIRSDGEPHKKAAFVSERPHREDRNPTGIELPGMAQRQHWRRLCRLRWLRSQCLVPVGHACANEVLIQWTVHVPLSLYPWPPERPMCRPMLGWSTGSQWLPGVHRSRSFIFVVVYRMSVAPTPVLLIYLIIPQIMDLYMEILILAAQQILCCQPF